MVTLLEAFEDKCIKAGIMPDSRTPLSRRKKKKFIADRLGNWEYRDADGSRKVWRIVQDYGDHGQINGRFRIGWQILDKAHENLISRTDADLTSTDLDGAYKALMQMIDSGFVHLDLVAEARPLLSWLSSK